jgi:hypothetical protein
MPSRELNIRGNDSPVVIQANHKCIVTKKDHLLAELYPNHI